MNSTDKHWHDVANKLLLDKKIVHVRYLTDVEASDMGWDKRPIVFILDDGTMCYTSADDEGNNGGSLFFQTKALVDGVLPTL